MKQFKYTPDDVEILVSATGKDFIQHRRKYIEGLIEDAFKGKKIFSTVQMN